MTTHSLILGEHILRNLEEEIINEKTKAYRIALQELYHLPLLFQPFIQNYNRKLVRQLEVLFQTAKEIHADSRGKQRRLRINFRRYYEKSYLYSLLLLQIPPIFAPNFIRGALKKLKRLNFRYFKRRVKFLLILFANLPATETVKLHSDSEILRRMFAHKLFLIEYIYSYIELERKKYQIIQKIGDWNSVPLEDLLHGFTISSVSFYQYVSSIWKTIDVVLPEFLRRKVEDLYHVRILGEGADELEIIKGGKYRYKLVKEFPCTPEVMKQVFHDPDTLIRNYPAKENIQIEKIAENRLRYTITEKIPLMKVIIKYDLVWQYKDNVEEWWVENGTYIKEMHGFAVYERTEEGNCRYADILVDFKLDDALKPIGEMIIPALEQIGRRNVEYLMENIYHELAAQNTIQVNDHKDKCQELG